MALDWQATMDRVNEKLLVTFPDALEYNGKSYECIAPPIERLKVMSQGPYESKATASFQMREADRARAGLLLREVFTHSHPTLGTLSFEVYAIVPDKNDSMVQLRCYLKQ